MGSIEELKQKYKELQILQKANGDLRKKIYRFN